MLAIFLFNPAFSAGWLWDLLQGTGYAAVAIWFYLIVDTGKSGSRTHQTLSTIALICAATHTLGLLWMDTTLWQYLTILGSGLGPGYMFAGLAGLACMTAALILALPDKRRFWHANYTQFRAWHNVLTWIALTCIAWHLFDSGAYLDSWGFWVLMGACGTLILVTRSITKRQHKGLSPEFRPIHLLAIPAGLAIFVLGRQF